MRSSPLFLPLRYAVRELRAGARGFFVFLACLALGVMAIAGVGSVSRSLSDGLVREGRIINGGDAAFSLISREATPDERAVLAREGPLSTIATLRAMARTADGRTALVEIKAVDGAYPLTGAATLTGGAALQDALAGHGGELRAVGDLALFARLDLKPGDRLAVGGASLVLADTLASEPDKLAGGVGFGPRLMMSIDTLRATGLIQPGSLIRWHYRLDLPAGVAPKAVAARANAAAPGAGWEVRTRDDATPALERGIRRFTLFLTLVGLTALLVGGVGVANAVRAFVDDKRDTVATLKTLGAPGSTVVGIYLAQTMILALLGIAAGLVLGAALPFAAAWALGAVLPLPLHPALYPRELLLALAYGLATAFAFSLWPLGRMHDMPVAALFRAEVDPAERWPRRRYRVLVGLAALGLAALAVGFASDRTIALVYVGAALAAFLALRLVGAAVMALARRLPRPRSTALRLALVNIHRPGALTPSVVLSLGLGLCLLVALALIDGNIRQQLSAAIPERAPSFFFVDIPDAEAPRFDDFVHAHAPGASLNRVPMLRGRIVAAKGVPAEKLKPPADIAWMLNGDRGITFSASAPSGSQVTKGQWWPADYAGPPLVSVEESMARGLGLDIGDTIAVNVLGRRIEARIATVRKVEWENLGINFVLVFSPNTFAGAPVMHLATLSYINDVDVATEVALLKQVAAAFPSVTTVRVKEALTAVADMAAQLAIGIRAAATIALVASVLVLAGALAAGHRARLYDAVVLKVLGATRGRLLAAFLLEYGLLGLATAVFGVAAGTAAAALVITQMMDFSFVFLPGSAVAAAFGAMVVTILIGLAGTWRILGQKPAGHLREL
ncbi:ABC transporter permease [Labrys wisconsinensis]|uniref:ABC transport system permease protein n=1 Tax=Labrys wisconsinensis TaxID=425677 RepID=A0ABU0J231_9HYPH|nr:FtsX-like permease family protein [Labrys wisconsinensis]MDQ0467503.1 putative ABC transport system permease protein [Labrys wisconsinensis]